MKYCSQCGERLEDGDIFCPACGSRQQEFAPVQAQAPAAVTESAPAQNEYDYPAADTSLNGEAAPVVPKAKKKKTGLIIGLAAAALVVLGVAALFVTGAYASLLPHSKLKLGLAENKLIQSVSANRYADFELPEAVDYRLTADLVTNDYVDYSTEEIADMIKDCTLTGSIDTVEGYGLAARLDYKGNTAVDLKLLMDEEQLGLYLSPASDDYYTFSTKKLYERLFPDEDPEKYKELFKTVDIDKVKKDYQNLLDIVLRSLNDAEIDIQKNMPVTLFDGEAHKAAVYTVPITEELVRDVLTAVIDYLDSDECYISDYIGEGYMTEGLVDMLLYGRYYGGYSGETKTFKEQLAEAREHIDETAREIAEQNLKFEVLMEGNDIIRQRIYNDEGCLAYESVKSGKTQRLWVYMKEDEDYAFRAECEIASRGNDRTINMDLFSDDEKVAGLECDIDISSRSVIGTFEGDYKLTVYSDWDESVSVVKMNVAPEANGFMHSVTYEADDDTAYYSGIDTVRAKLFVASGSRVKVPAGVETVDISDYSDMKLMRLANTLASKLSSRLEDLFD